MQLHSLIPRMCRHACAVGAVNAISNGRRRFRRRRSIDPDCRLQRTAVCCDALVLINPCPSYCIHSCIHSAFRFFSPSPPPSLSRSADEMERRERARLDEDRLSSFAQREAKFRAQQVRSAVCRVLYCML